MIKQITEKSIGQRFKFHFFYSPEKVLFFEIIGEKPKILEKYQNSLWNYLVEDVQAKSLPKGIFSFAIIDDRKIFGVEYDEREITEEKVIEFVKSLEL